ncbi:hypothetical protein BG618_01798 [Pseudonocardia autotrophica]|nr:hypothetical protein BG618_01798 [Pseudonocardia autotrophica]
MGHRSEILHGRLPAQVRRARSAPGGTASLYSTRCRAATRIVAAHTSRHEPRTIRVPPGRNPVRLDRAHRDLIAADRRTATVAEIATRWVPVTRRGSRPTTAPHTWCHRAAPCANVAEARNPILHVRPRATSRPPRRLGSGHHRNSDHGPHRRHLRRQGRPAAGRARRRPRRYPVAMEPGRRWGRPAAPPVPAAPRHLDRRPVTGCTAVLGDTPRCRGYRTTMWTRSRKPTGSEPVSTPPGRSDARACGARAARDRLSRRYNAGLHRSATRDHDMDRPPAVVRRSGPPRSGCLPEPTSAAGTRR